MEEAGGAMWRLVETGETGEDWRDRWRLERLVETEGYWWKLGKTGGDWKRLVRP